MPRADQCDLHSHTLHSDGALTPEALVDLAAERGVGVLAVTDHDTVAAFSAAAARGRLRGVEVVAAIELSVDYDGRDIHLLGYFIQHPEVLRAALESLAKSRIDRADVILARLRSLGVDLDSDAVRARAQGPVGRPHIAAELIERGFASHFNEAFDRWLGHGKPAYVPKVAPSLAEGVALLRRAGAAPVVAHPGASDVDDCMAQFAAAGVVGLEVHHPKHDPVAVRRYLRHARAHGFVATGGSDFHRAAPGAALPGDVTVPRAVLDALRARAGEV